MNCFTPPSPDAVRFASLIFAHEQPALTDRTGQSPAAAGPSTPGLFDASPNVFERSAAMEETWPMTEIDPDQIGFTTTASMPQFWSSSHDNIRLCRAARSGDTLGVMEQLQQGSDVNAWGRGETVPCTPLIAAVENGHAAVVNAMLGAGADANLSNGHVRAALYCAAQRGNLAIVAMLLRQPGIQAGAAMQDGTTPFHQAACGGHVAVARILLEAELVPIALRRECLADACRRGDAAMVDLLYRGDMRADDMNGANCLQIGAAHGHAVVVAYLLKNGVAAAVRSDDGVTALQRACLKGHVGMVDLLLSQPGNQLNNPGLSMPLLHLAVNAGHVPMMNYLLDAGAAPNATDPRTGRTALMNATDGAKPGVLDALLACPRISVNLACHSGWTALQLAMFSGTRDAVISLLKAGAVVEMPNDYNYRKSLLWRAVARKDGEMVMLMLARGGTSADQGAVLCQAAAAHAAESGCADLVERLLDAGHRVPAREGVIRFVSQASTRTRRPASARSTDAPIDYASAVAIADLTLVHTRAHELWPTTALTSGLDARGARLQTFNLLIAPLTAHQIVFVGLRDTVLLHLHKSGLLLATALSLADCLIAAFRRLQRAPGAGPAADASQTAVYCAVAVSMLDLHEQNAAAAALYSRSNISTDGRSRVVGAAHRQFINLKNMAGEASMLAGEQMLAKITPTCVRAMDGRSPVDASSLVTELLAVGQLLPLAQIVAASWREAIAWRLAAPIEIPPGATFVQVTQHLDDAVGRLGKSHLAPAILLALNEAGVRSSLRELSTTGRIGDDVPLLQIQTAQLRHFAERMRQD
jgi:ankyrin repeat protein